MSLSTFETPPNLAIHKYPAAALFRVLRADLLALDDVTRQGRSLFGGGFGNPQELVTANPYREAWGSFRALPGMTTLTVVIRSSGVTSGDVLRVYLNGALSSTQALANGEQVLTVALGAYATNSVVEVTFEIFNATRPTPFLNGQWGNFEIQDAYVGPVTLGDPWPGVPTFSGTSFTRAQALQLSLAVDWLVRKVGRRTEPLFQSITRWKGPYTTQTTVRWHGGAVVSPACPTLLATGVVRVEFPGATEQVRLIVNGSVVSTYNVPSATGEYAYTLSHTLSGATDTRVPIVVDMVRTVSPGTFGGAEPVSRFSLLRVWMEGDAGIYGAISIPNPAARQLMTWSTWRAALQAAANAAATLKSRIDSNPDLWDRQRLFRRRHAYDDYQNRVYEPGQIALSMGRRGEALLVRGKGNRVCWGPGEFDNNSASKQEVGLYESKQLNEQGVCQGDAPRTELVYHDTLPGLYPTQAYNVRGELLAYAGEVLWVGQDVS